MCDIETLRLFINERLSAVAEDILSVFVRTLVDYQRQLDLLNPPVKTQPADFFPVCEEEVSPGHPERSDREEAYGSALPLLAVKCEDGGDGVETEPVASTSALHVTTQADVQACGTSQPTSDVQILSSESEPELTEDSDEWEETRGDQSALKPLKSHERQHVEGKRLSLGSELSQDLESPKQTLPSGYTGEKSLNFAFNQSRHLKSLIRIDTGENCFSCTFCGRGFSQMSNLKKHTMTHTGEKPFWCTVCGKGFNQKVNLKTHFRVHTGEKPFSCTICGKSFNQHGTVKMHMRVHTGEKPYACSICGKSFSQRGVLKSHMGIHIAENCPKNS